MDKQGDYLVATLKNAYRTRSGSRKDGSRFESMSFLQVEWQEPQESGFALRSADLLVDSIGPYKEQIGKLIQLPIRVYISNGKVQRSIRAVG
jgi:hypothetical protein